MELENQKGTDLEQEIQRMKGNIIPMQMKNNNEIGNWTHSFKNVFGFVKLASSPHYGLILETVPAEKPFVLPIVMVDSTKHINQWISVVGKKVLIDQLFINFERFQNFDGCQDLECMNAVVMWEDIKVLEASRSLQQIDRPPNEQLPIESLQQNDIKASDDSDNSCQIMVHHVSSAFYIDQPPALCLVLISFINKNLVETKLWLILKAEQVSWKDFLIPNREYLVSFPQQLNKFYLFESQKPLKELFSSCNRELKVIFHHQNLFPTLNGCFLPSGSKISLASNTQFSEYVCQFVNDTSCLWFSSNEADHADTSLVTFYGLVDVIKYDYESVFKSCYLCLQAKARQPSLAKPNFTTTHSWTNPWISKSSLNKGELVALPTAEDDYGDMNLGVPGKLVQIIKLRDVTTGEERSIYVKHSFISQCQQISRLSSGMVVCVTYLNRRCSAKGKYYYLTTVLSTFKVLSLPNRLCQNESWGLYGLNCSTKPSYQDRMWGVLETINLTKVAITAKCTNCSSVFYNGICSTECLSPASKVSAHAIGWLQIIQDENTVLMDKVVVKDSLVRELLCIPEDIWNILLKASLKQELVYFFSDQDWTKPPVSLDLSELFRMYCLIPKPYGKFYVSVKNVSSISDSDPVYYCIHLQPVEESRLKIIGQLAKKALNK